MMQQNLLFLVRWGLLGLAFATGAVFVGLPLLEPAANVAAGTSKTAFNGYRHAVMRAAPAVVGINAFTIRKVAKNPLLEDPVFQDFFGEQTRASRRRETSFGSGVILQSSGLILTNLHVVRDATQITAHLFDGRSAEAKLLGSDPETDLAVLKIELERLPSIPLGDADQTEVGDIVLAIGNALGIGQTVTQGIISATGRNRIGINTFENFIQTDAAINFGNSGGALVNVHGQLIGINSLRLDSEGIGFAIPVNMAVNVANQLIATGKVERGWIGIDARDLTPSQKQDFAVPHGVMVLDVLEDGPAARAGIAVRDVLVSLDDHALFDSRTAIEHIAASKPGSEISITGVRDGHAHSWRITTARRPLSSAAR